MNIFYINENGQRAKTRSLSPTFPFIVISETPLTSWGKVCNIQNYIVRLA